MAKFWNEEHVKEAIPLTGSILIFNISKYNPGEP